MLAALLLNPVVAGRPKVRRRRHYLSDGRSVWCTFQEFEGYLDWLDEQAEKLRLKLLKSKGIRPFKLKKTVFTLEYYLKKIGDYYEDD